MTPKQVKKILTYVARHSPKEFATTIKDRNERLLRLLNNRTGGKITVGCPHCRLASKDLYGCRGCLWVVAIKAARVASAGRYTWLACIHVPFNGVTLIDVGPDLRKVRVLYNCKDAAVVFVRPNKKEEDECRRFLKGHIEWASRSDWGREYKH